MAISGSTFVRSTRQSNRSIKSNWYKTRDQFEVWGQAKKLMFWDQRHNYPPGVLCDCTYESIKGITNVKVYEMRLDGVIGGQSNIRVVFLDPPHDWIPLTQFKSLVKNVWLLEIIPKRRDNWTSNDLNRFRSTSLLVQQQLHE